MFSTIAILLGGLGTMLVGVGLLGTLLGVRAALAGFSSLETGVIMAAYYLGYVAGTALAPRLVRHVGHIRSFAAFAALGSATTLAFGLLVEPWFWLLIRMINGVSVIGLYIIVESWINEQSTGGNRGRVFALYMMSTLLAMGAGQFLLMAGEISGLTLFVLCAIFISVGAIPVAVTRVTEPRVEAAVSVKLGQLLSISPLGTVGVFTAGVVNGAFWGMTPLFGQRLGLDEGDIALLMSATILGGALLQWPVGHVSDLIDRRWALVLTAAATTLAAAAGALVEIRGTAAIVLPALVYGGLMFSLYGVSVAHANDHLEAGQVLEATRGLLLVYGFGAVCGPLLGGAAMTGIGPVGLPVVAMATTAGLALFGLFRMTRRAAPPIEEQTEFVPLVRTSPVALEMHPEADPEPELDLPRVP